MTEAQNASAWAINLAWIAWAGVWVWLARGTKPVLRQESAASRLLHLAPLGVGAALLFGWPWFRGTWLEAAILPRAPWMVFAGLALVLAGLAFAVWARLILAGNWSGTVTLKQAHELVRRGPYGLVRHPIYTGLLLAMIGTAIAIDAWRGPVAVAIVAASFLRKLRTEEAFMRAEFGAAYTAYAAEVPALVPRIRRKKAVLF